jgi:hypothetical protein
LFNRRYGIARNGESLRMTRFRGYEDESRPEGLLPESRSFPMSGIFEIVNLRKRLIR